MNKNQDELVLILINQTWIKKKTMISKIDSLLKNNEDPKLKLSKIRAIQTSKINAQKVKNWKNLLFDNKILTKQVEKLTEQLPINSIDKLICFINILL